MNALKFALTIKNANKKVHLFEVKEKIVSIDKFSSN